MFRSSAEPWRPGRARRVRRHALRFDQCRLRRWRCDAMTPEPFGKAGVTLCRWASANSMSQSRALAREPDQAPPGLIIAARKASSVGKEGLAAGIGARRAKAPPEGDNGRSECRPAREARAGPVRSEQHMVDRPQGGEGGCLLPGACQAARSPPGLRAPSPSETWLNARDQGGRLKSPATTRPRFAGHACRRAAARFRASGQRPTAAGTGEWREAAPGLARCR